LKARGLNENEAMINLLMQQQQDCQQGRDLKTSYTPIIALHLQSEALLKISPNPVQDKLHISFTAPNGGTVEVSIYDQSGRLLSTERRQAGRGSNSFTLASNPRLLPGLYYLRISGESVYYNRKFVRE